MNKPREAARPLLCGFQGRLIQLVRAGKFVRTMGKVLVNEVFMDIFTNLPITNAGVYGFTRDSAHWLYKIKRPQQPRLFPALRNQRTVSDRRSWFEFKLRFLTIRIFSYKFPADIEFYAYCSQYMSL